jgi:hypothetical protein
MWAPRGKRGGSPANVGTLAVKRPPAAHVPMQANLQSFPQLLGGVRPPRCVGDARGLRRQGAGCVGRTRLLFRRITAESPQPGSSSN